MKFLNVLSNIGKIGLQVAGIASGFGPVAGGVLQAAGVKNAAAFGSRVGAIGSAVAELQDPVLAIIHGPISADMKGLQGEAAMQEVLSGFEQLLAPANKVLALAGPGYKLAPDMNIARQLAQRAYDNIKEAEQIQAEAKAFYESLKPVLVGSSPVPSPQD